MGAFAAPAAAQSATVAGQVGATFQSEVAPVFAAEVGVPVAPAVSIYGTFGRMQDAMPNDVQDLLDFFDTGIEASIPAFYGIGGVRVGVPAGPVQPYGVFGAGFARLSADIEVGGVDVTDLAEDELGFDLSSTEFAFELGGGVMLPVGERAFVDAGYRYMRITDVDFNVSRIYGGFGVRF
jgi:hypothetical protein